MSAKTVGCWIAEMLSRILLATVFIYASWSKIQDPALFMDAIRSYQLHLPELLIAWVAIVLPPAEAVVACALVATKWVRESALLVCAMLLVFLFGLTQAWIRGLEISCGCFGPEDGAAAPLWLDILRDLALLVPSVWLTIRPNRWLFGR